MVLKAQGNEHFKRRDYPGACGLYSQAIDALTAAGEEPDPDPSRETLAPLAPLAIGSPQVA